MRSSLLLIDAIVNLVLGAALIWFPDWLVRLLGVPHADPAFYAAILGAVLFGIGVALLLELRAGRGPTAGLGLGGAVAINLSGGAVLAAWLIGGGLDLPIRGVVFLWALVFLLVCLSTVELAAQVRRRSASPSA
jgi:hypothetical protein